MCIDLFFCFSILIKNAESKEILILQPHLIKNLEAKFGDEVKSKSVYKTSGTLRFKIVRPDNDDDIIETNLQSRYRSRVGIMLYLIKYSQPDLCNVVREISKCMDKATMRTYFEMLRVVKFVINNKHLSKNSSRKQN
jgi:23S rRNA G2445 N2-methylase RlmL